MTRKVNHQTEKSKTVKNGLLINQFQDGVELGMHHVIQLGALLFKLTRFCPLYPRGCVCILELYCFECDS